MPIGGMSLYYMHKRLREATRGYKRLGNAIYKVSGENSREGNIEGLVRALRGL